MIDLRWVEIIEYLPENAFEGTNDKKLQFRQVGNFYNPVLDHMEERWSEWIEVPTVKEE